MKRIKQVITDLYHSIFNNEKGASARKLTALAAFWTAFELSQSLENENRLYAVYAFHATALLCLGIVTFANIIELKNGNKPT